MITSQSILALRRGHPLELFPLFRRWPRSTARDLLYTALWNTLVGFGLAALYIFGNGRAPFHIVFGDTLLASQCVGFSIHGALRLLELVVPPSASRSVARLLDLMAIVLFSAFGIALSGAIQRGAFSDYLHSDALAGLLMFGLVIGVAMLAVLIAGERRVQRQNLDALRREQMATAAQLLAEAQLRTLQAQIEPHFLYNTLANVVSLIDTQPAKARHMLERFIDYLRASLAASRAEHATVGSELALASAYLDVLGVRLEGRLRWRCELAPDLSALSIPPMLLQPLVENAIMHGIEPKLDGGEIVLCACLDGAALCVEVRDNGCGLRTVSPRPRPASGVGLTNLRERLRELYGAGAQLQLIENPAGGVTSRLLLPLTVPSSTIPSP